MAKFLANQLVHTLKAAPSGDIILQELLDVYNRLVLEPNASKDEELQHENMINLCDELISARYLFVYNQQDPIDSVDFSKKG